ncbi:O-antigen polysaccharide polymerase Wzy [Fundicoccus sp. Sow4_D5]|uniref:O-antigen polysaccharide polymerase Wzy n=1 Tax=Fundicoccus sp. Sow4_D5 TaxID=3438782 RepID=UPI003F8F1889
MNIRTTVYSYLLMVSISFIGLFNIIGSKQGIVIACLICFILYFLSCVSNIRTHFLGILFGIVTFGFLFGSFVLDQELMLEVGIDELALYCFCLSLSLLGIFLGLNLGSMNRKQNINDLEEYNSDRRIKKVFVIANKIFWIALPFSYIYALFRAYFAINYGYVYLYNNPTIFLSGSLSFITDISSLTNVAFIILLSTLPKISKVRNQTIALTVYNMLLLLSGTRAGLLKLLFLIASYFFIMRHSYEKKALPKKKIMKYMLIAFILISFFSIIFTTVVNFRSGDNYYSDNKNPLINLISSEGKTWRVVIDAFEVYDKTTMSQHLRFYFKPLINSISLQFIFERIGLGFVQALPYTSEFALNSYNYSHFYTYTADPSLYLSGGGLGSSYLAESYFLGQYFGVFFHSILIGFFLSGFISKVSKSLWKNAYMWTFIFNIFWSPRGSALGPYFSFFSFSNLIVFIGLYLYLELTQDKIR